MKIDRSLLPEGVSFDRKEGLYAKLGPEGQVLHLGVYQNGVRKPGTWALDVAPDGSHARVEQTLVHEWRPEVDDSDQDEPPQSLRQWAVEWMEKISDAMKDRSFMRVCSFCGKSQSEVRKLIAGPSVFICDECVSLCNDIISEEAPPLE